MALRTLWAASVGVNFPALDRVACEVLKIRKGWLLCLAQDDHVCFDVVQARDFFGEPTTRVDADEEQKSVPALCTEAVDGVGDGGWTDWILVQCCDRWRFLQQLRHAERDG